MEQRMEYERNLNHTYVVFRGMEQEMEYEMQMLLNNRISGLLDCKMELIDGKGDLYYEITSKQPLKRVYEKQKMTYNVLKELFQGLYDTILKMEEFLLPADSIMMEPEMIYVDLEKTKFYFCANPAIDKKETPLQALMEFLLDCIDYEDEKAVATAYEWYKKSGEENSSFMKIYQETFELRSYNKLEKEQENQKITQRKIICDLPEEKYSIEEHYKINKMKEERAEDKQIQAVKNQGIFQWVVGKIRDLYNRIQRQDVETEEWDIEDFICEEEAEETWDCDRKYQEQEQVSKVSLYEGIMEISSKETEQQENVYGETVFFKNEYMTEVRCLAPCTNNFPELKMEVFPYVLGKLKGAVDGVIEHETISRIHCKIELEKGEYYITDLNSTNGTVINDEVLNTNEKRKLNVGDEIRLGQAVYNFC